MAKVSISPLKLAAARAGKRCSAALAAHQRPLGLAKLGGRKAGMFLKKRQK